jgi:hypothetical protein
MHETDFAARRLKVIIFSQAPGVTLLISCISAIDSTITTKKLATRRSRSRRSTKRAEPQIAVFGGQNCQCSRPAKTFAGPRSVL